MIQKPQNKKLGKDEYHKMIDHVSASMLKQLAADPTVYHDTYVSQEVPPKGQTRAMEIGSILHEALLDEKPLRSIVGIYPDYNEDYDTIKGLTGPKRDKLTDKQLKTFAGILGCSVDELKTAKGGAELNALKANCPENCLTSKGGLNGKAAERFRQANPEYRYFLKRAGSLDQGKTPSYEKVKAAMAAVRSSDYYQILESKHVLKEQEIFWETDGLKKRACPDFLFVDKQRDFAQVWDMKVTEKALSYSRDMVTMRNWIQQAHYSEGIREVYGVSEVKFTFLAVMPVYPFHGCEYEFRQIDISDIETDYYGLIEELKTRTMENDWLPDQVKNVNFVYYKSNN